MKKIEDIEIKSKLVLVRADLNVPLDENCNITDENRINQFLPTLNYLIEQEAKIVIMSHLGRPKGEFSEKFSLKPVANRLGELINKDVALSPDCVGDETKNLARNLKEGEVLLLENLRFHTEEKENDSNFSKELASLAEVYISDAFATAHRSHASTVGVTDFIKEKAAGFLMKKEIEYYEKALVDPKRPLCVILGGAKISTKLKTLLNISKFADKIIIGGAMANTFWAAQGVQMGKSLYEPEMFPTVLEILAGMARKDSKFYLPIDFRIGSSTKGAGMTKAVTAQEVPADMMALDIGPATGVLFEEALANCETIVWNGPMGLFEHEDFSEGTTDMIKACASSSALTVVGGGDTAAAIFQHEMQHKFDYISTGGGAFLALMEGKTLPGVKVLE